MDPTSFLPTLCQPAVLGTVVALIGAGGMLFFYFLSGKRGHKLKPLVDLEDQTYEVEDGFRVSRFVKEGKLWSCVFDDAKTLYEGFRRGLRMSQNGPALGFRYGLTDENRPNKPSFTWITYGEVLNRAENLARGFLELGLEMGQNTYIGIYSKNRPEWVIVEQASYVYNMVIVPLYDTLGPDACSYVMNHTEVRLVVVDSCDKAKLLLNDKPHCPLLQFVVVIEPVESQELRDRAEAAGVELWSLEELEKLGQSRSTPHSPPTPDSIATICYTSGTTGKPKGVVLTHGNVVADTTSMLYLDHGAIVQQDTCISYLPLAHMMERIVEMCVFSVGGKVGYFSGNVANLLDDMETLRPTVVPVVPRVLNKIYDKTMQEVNRSVFKRFLFNWALASKTADLKDSIVGQYSVWDRLVFAKVRAKLGGRAKLMITGSAPLADNVLQFVRAALGCVVVEGYGQTECTACATLTFEGDHFTGQVGSPVACCAFKLIDAPELGYFASNGQGEICIRGHNVFKRYHKEPELTAKTLSSDGSLRTGDIGELTNKGTLKIIDRVKHIFKLSQGEYVAPEKIENVYLRSKYVAQMFVYGRSLKSHLIAVVVPDLEVLRSDATDFLDYVEVPTDEFLFSNAAVNAVILADMDTVGKEAKLRSFEMVRAIHVAKEAFSVENELLTPTMKSKRTEIARAYEKELERLYDQFD